MPLTANKSFQLTADQHFTRGETVPADVWNRLRPRTQHALLGARFVVHVEGTAASEAPKQKRGK